MHLTMSMETLCTIYNVARHGGIYNIVQQPYLHSTSSMNHCDICGTPVSQGNPAFKMYASVSLYGGYVLQIQDNIQVSYFGLSSVPFHLRACSKLCHQKMTSHYSVQYLVGLYFKAFERCGMPSAHEFNPTLPCSMGMVTSKHQVFCMHTS